MASSSFLGAFERPIRRRLVQKKGKGERKGKVISFLFLSP